MAQPVVAQNVPEFYSPAFDYKPRQTTQPYYKHTKVLPMSGTQSVTITPSAQIETLMEIPVKVFNNSQNILDFNAYVESHAGAYTWERRDAITFISQAQLMTRGGVVVGDINNLQNFSNSVRKAQTSQSEIASNDYSCRLYHSNNLGDAASALFPCGTTAGAITYEEGFNYVSESISYIGGSAAATPPVGAQRRIILPFNQMFRNTPMALNKNLYFGEPLILRILWGPGVKVGFQNTAFNTTPVGGTAISANVQITNLTLYLAVESNPDNVKSVIHSFNTTGLTTLVPYVHSYKYTLNGAGTHNISLRFNRSAHGRTLKCVYIVPYHATETGPLAYDHSNSFLTADVQKISSYYTSLDSQRIQEYNVSCVASAGDDWRLHQPLLKESMIIGRYHYMVNWFHCDDFSNITGYIDPKIPNNLDRELIFAGEPLDVEKRYDFTAEANATINYYCWAVCQRLLVIRPNDIHFE